MRTELRLIDQNNNMGHSTQHFRSEQSGAEVVFNGVVRADHDRRSVQYLDFEAYTPMVEAEANRIFEEAAQQWSLHAIVLEHRTGRVFPGEMAVQVAVYSKHRKAAFEACQFVMDELKKRLPIWKKEVFSNGEAWVHPHP